MITKDNFADFVKAYETAVELKMEKFTFLGRDVLTQYAKYAIEYIKNLNI